jgi:hypothetical protein
MVVWENSRINSKELDLHGLVFSQTPTRVSITVQNARKLFVLFKTRVGVFYQIYKTRGAAERFMSDKTRQRVF